MSAPPQDLTSLSDIMYIDEDAEDLSDVPGACASQSSTDLTLTHPTDVGIKELVRCTCSSILRSELQNLESQSSVTGSHESSCDMFVDAVDQVSSFSSCESRRLPLEDVERYKNVSATPKSHLKPQAPGLDLIEKSPSTPPETDYIVSKLESDEQERIEMSLDAEDELAKSETTNLITSCEEAKIELPTSDQQQLPKQRKKCDKHVKAEAGDAKKTVQKVKINEQPKIHQTLAEVGKCDTAPSALTSIVSDTAAESGKTDKLPQNCSVAYTCTDSELEDLSKSKYQGLSGHLMDYYLTMVFPGQPGNQDRTENGTCGPIEPIFQIGGELIQKTPITKTALEDEFDSGDRKIILGICAMEKKSRSKPMLAILERLAWFEYIETLIFDENTILHEPVERWPICDVFVSFHSRGFPLSKAVQYVNCRKPIVVNDLDLQYTLQDRRAVHRILEQENIPQPRYMVVDRDTSEVKVLDNKTELPLSNGSSFIEMEDSVEMDGMVFQKPFVEKPVSAEDHNVYIYFPTAAGGGSQRLFRKVGSRSSIYSNYTRVRKTGSYIYEDFMPTDGTDVKVYTVGPDYAHAEARKSPALDGKVERDQNGKEVRYPVILSANEKMIARKVTLAFKQTVCGFDLLRANGESLVCDVNGFSFVKTSSKYYDDCAKVLGTMIMRALAPQLHIPWVLGSAPEDIPVVPTTSGTMMELRCVTAVIRHGDRTPKQKMKMEVKQKRFFELFEKYDGYKTGQLKLKQPKHLQEVLDIVRYLLQEHQVRPDPEIEEKKAKLEQLKLVLEMYGYFSGINRKVQLKYQPNGRPKRSSSEDVTPGVSADMSEGRDIPQEPDITPEVLMYEFTGINRKVQIKDQPYSASCQTTQGIPPNTSQDDDTDDSPREPSLLLIVKWGGELTPAGKIQAEQLGKAFRSLYPGGQGEYGAPGLGILRLHSTYRHDLKIYASDEGRVQMTAAAFAKGLLALEGELPPILVQMVKCANTNGLLDSEGETTKYQHVVKEKLRDILNQDRDFTELDYAKLAPALSQSLIKAIRYIRNPFQMCEKVHEMVREITAKVRRLKVELKSEEKKLYHGETWDLMLRRWAKLEKDFKMKNGYFDINKIPDIYDCIKYDFQHNQKILQFDKAEKLYACSKALADIVIPQEYGITKEEKLHISQSYCSPLLRKIRSDLDQVVSQDHEDDITRLDSRYSKGVATPHRFVRTRLYFTSESHIHSMLTMLRYGGLLDEMKDEQWKRAMEYISDTAELNYMTQIVIMMYEDPNKEYTSAERFHVELHFSPGAYTCDHTAPKDTHATKSMTNTPLSEVQERVSSKTGWTGRHHHKLFGGPVVAVSMDPEKANMFDAIREEQERVPQPRSPDPNIPEWDWGEDEEEAEVKVNQEVKSVGKERPEEGEGSRSVTPQPMEEGLSQEDQTSSSTVCSSKDSSWGQGLDTELGTSSSGQPERGRRSRTPTRPISIARERPIIQISDSDGSRPQSLEEKRSQSFEEKSEGPEGRPRLLSLPPSPNKLKEFYANRYQRSSSLLEVPTSLPMVERHYLTVQLPLVDPKQKHRHSFANIFTVPDFIGTGETFRGLFGNRVLLGSNSAPNLESLNPSKSDEAFTKLHVPSIQPLETLYNSLTLRQLDNFLERITTVKFMTPASTPPSHLMSPHEGGSPHGDSLYTGLPFSVHSLSSSANSSPGPSSPMTTEDVVVKLRIYMMEKQFAAETSTYHQPNRAAISQPYIPPGHERQPHHILHKPTPQARKQDQSHIHLNIPNYSLSGSRRQFLGHAPFLKQSDTDSVPTSGYSYSGEEFSSFWPDSESSFSWKFKDAGDMRCPTEPGSEQASLQPREQKPQDDSHSSERHCTERDQTSSKYDPLTSGHGHSEDQYQMSDQGHFDDEEKDSSQSETTAPDE